MQVINVLVVSIKDTDKDILTNLLTSLEYSFLTVDYDYATVQKTLSQYHIESILFPFDLVHSKDWLYYSTYLNIRAKYSCIYYNSIISREMLSDLKKYPPPIYLCQLGNKDNIYINIELARHYSLIQKKQKKGQYKTFFFIKQNQDYIKLNFEDISYVKSEHIYLRVYTLTGKNYLIRDNLKRFILVLPNFFLRCHRSYIINLKYTNAIQPKSILMLDDKEIPITKNYRQELLKTIYPIAFNKPRT